MIAQWYTVGRSAAHSAYMPGGGASAMSAPPTPKPALRSELPAALWVACAAALLGSLQYGWAIAILNTSLVPVLDAFQSDDEGVVRARGQKAGQGGGGRQVAGFWAGALSRTYGCLSDQKG